MSVETRPRDENPQQESRNSKAEAKAAKAYAKASRPWYKKKRWWAAGLLLIVIIASAGGGAGSDDSEPAVSENTSQDSQSEKPAADKEPATKESAAKKEPAAQKEPEITSGQENALESAQSYVDMTGFSKAGLIQQLSSSAGEGFSKADATFAANNVDADWNKEEQRGRRLEQGGCRVGAELPRHDGVLEGRPHPATVVFGR
jgi:hypothetical protein